MVGHRLTHLFSKYKNNFISPLILTFKVVKICKTGEKKDPLSASFNQLQDTAFTSFFFPSFSNNIKYVILLFMYISIGNFPGGSVIKKMSANAGNTGDKGFHP